MMYFTGSGASMQHLDPTQTGILFHRSIHHYVTGRRQGWKVHHYMAWMRFFGGCCNSIDGLNAKPCLFYIVLSRRQPHH
jgi:hypothetical protein